MRKIAILFIFLFAFVQCVPAILSVDETTIAFIIDMGEQGEENSNPQDALEKKDYDLFQDAATRPMVQWKENTQLAVNLIAPPVLEKPTPPPNHS